MSRRRVPAALHRELSEYASLLRALRTRDVLDVAKHLTKPSPYDLSHTNASSEDERRSSTFSDSLRSRSRSKENEEPTRKKQIPRDHWTRWPLMLNDVLEPEWTLEDEVAVVASHVQKANASSLPLQESSSEDPLEDGLMVLDMQPEDDDPDHAYYIPSLTCIISDYLSSIFGHLASLTPPRPASMQNRIEPLNWQAVIYAVVSLGDPEYSNPKVLRNVIRRLEAIYGPSVEDGFSTSHRPIDRAEQIVTSADQRHHQQEDLLAKVFDQASPPRNLEFSFTERAQAVTDEEEHEFIARRRRIAEGKRPEGEEDNGEASTPTLGLRRSSRINLNIPRDSSSPIE